MQSQDIQGFEKNVNTFLEYYDKPSESFRDDRFGKIKILQNKYNPKDKLMMKEIKSRHLYQCEKDLFQVKERYGMNHTNLLEMTSYTYGKVKSNSGKKYYIVSGFYEYNENSLDKLIQNQKRKGEKFQGEFLLQLFEDVLKVVAFLQKNERLHGDIRPKYIFYDDNKEIFKLADRLGDPRQPNQIQLSYLKKNKDIYMSPSIFEVLINRESCLKHNPYKSEVFSLGMVVLECGVLKSIQDIYDRQNKSISLDKMIEYLEEFFLNYPDNEVLLEILQSSLELSPKLRKDPRATLKNLYKQKQSSRQNFELNQDDSQSQDNLDRDNLDKEFRETEKKYLAQQIVNNDQQIQKNEKKEQINLRENQVEDLNMDYEFDQLDNRDQNKQFQIDLTQVSRQNNEQYQRDDQNQDQSNQESKEQINDQYQNEEDNLQYGKNMDEIENDSQVSVQENLEQNSSEQQVLLENQETENQVDFENKLRMFNNQNNEDTFYQEDNQIQEQSEISELQEEQQENRDNEQQQMNQYESEKYQINVNEIDPQDQAYFESTANQGYFHQVESEQSSEDSDNIEDNNSEKTLENKYDKAQTSYKAQNESEKYSNEDFDETEKIEKQDEKINNQQNQNKFQQQYSLTINGQIQEDYLSQQEQSGDKGPSEQDIEKLQENVYEEPLPELNFDMIQNKEIMKKQFKPIDKIQLPLVLQDLCQNQDNNHKFENFQHIQFSTDNNNFSNICSTNFDQNMVKSLDLPMYDKPQENQQIKKKENMREFLAHIKQDRLSQSKEQEKQFNQKQERHSQVEEIRKKHFKISNEKNLSQNESRQINSNIFDQYQNNQMNQNAQDYQNTNITSQLNPKILISQYEQKPLGLDIRPQKIQEPLHYKSYEEYQAHKQQRQSQESSSQNADVRIRQMKRSKEKSFSKEILGYQQSYRNVNNYMLNSVDDIPIRLEKNLNEIPIPKFIEKNSVQKNQYLNVDSDIKQRVSKTTGRQVDSTNLQKYNVEDRMLNKNVSSQNLHKQIENPEQKNYINLTSQNSTSYLQQKILPGSHRVISTRQKQHQEILYNERQDFNFNKNPFYSNDYQTSTIRRITHDPQSNQRTNEQVTRTQNTPIRMMSYTQKEGFRSERVIPQSRQYQFSQQVSHIIKDAKEVVNNNGKVVRRIKLQQQLIIKNQWLKF